MLATTPAPASRSSRDPRRALPRLSSLARTAAAALLGASAAFASGTVVGFEGPNIGGWTYGLPIVIESAGGNPGSWLHAAPDTFAPQLRTSVVTPEFHGNWRAREVASIGVDLLTVSTQFPAARPLSVILSSGSCQIYFVGTSEVPQPGTGWKSFDFAIDSQSTVMPPGWAILSGPCTQPDTAWNGVMQNVTEVRFFYGDPTFFFIFDIWNVGADNPRIFNDVFTTLGGALAGSNGLPQLAGKGTLVPGSPVSLTLSSALPNSTAALIVGLSAVDMPFKGGTLVPAPDILITGLPVSGTGTLALASTWPAGLPAGLSLWFQEWIVDPAGPKGFAASNGLLAITP
jgi:hypothetical protein